MSTININIERSTLVNKIKQHLAVIGKRARDAQGNSLYSDINTSSNEDSVVWNDMIDGGAEVIVATLAPLSGNYVSTTGTISFNVTCDRWKTGDEDDITPALQSAVETFIWNYAIKEYLALIHPSAVDKYPPRWAYPYELRMQTEVSTIQEIAYLKRAPQESDKEYSSITGEVVEDNDINEEEINSYDNENPFTYLQAHNHGGCKGRNLHKRFCR